MVEDEDMKGTNEKKRNEVPGESNGRSWGKGEGIRGDFKGVWWNVMGL